MGREQKAAATGGVRARERVRNLQGNHPWGAHFFNGMRRVVLSPDFVLEAVALVGESLDLLLQSLDLTFELPLLPLRARLVEPRLLLHLAQRFLDLSVRL